MHGPRYRKYRSGRSEEASSDTPMMVDDDSNQNFETFENIEKSMNRRLRHLYPAVREKDDKLCLPRRWDKSQASSYLEIGKDGLNVTFRKNIKLKDEKDPSAVIRANSSIPMSCGLYYFEIDIVQGHRGCMGIGLSRRDSNLNRMPGWDANCYGYHGDDGNFFSACGHGVPYGPKFGTGDTIGCGMDSVLRHVFFTKNGKHLGVAFEGMETVGMLFPTVGLKIPGEQICVNFGQKPFAFDVEKHRDGIAMKQKRELIEKMPLMDDSTKHFKRIISSFLAHSGAIETLKMFEKTIKPETKEDYSFLEKRTEIVNMIMRGEHGVKIETKLRTTFGEILSDHPAVHVLLICLRYIDIAATIKSMPIIQSKACEESPLSPKSLLSSSTTTTTATTMTTMTTPLTNTEQHQGSSSASSSSASSSSYKSNPNKRTRSKEDGQNSNRRSGEIAPATKKSPVSGRRLKKEEKNGEAKKEETMFIRFDDEVELVKIDKDLNTSKELYKQLCNDDEIEKLKYLINMGQKIMSITETCELCEISREIIEISLSMIYKSRKITDPHPLSEGQRRFIANKVMGVLNSSTKRRQYSELRGLFMAWEGMHRDMKIHPTASLPLIPSEIKIEDGELEETKMKIKNEIVDVPMEQEEEEEEDEEEEEEDDDDDDDDDDDVGGDDDDEEGRGEDITA